MAKYNTERAKASRAMSVAKKRSAKVAGLKRARTTLIKGAAVSAGILGATALVNKYLDSNIGLDSISQFVATGKNYFKLAGFFY